MHDRRRRDDTIDVHARQERSRRLRGPDVRRRPSGEAPPLPRDLGRSGKFWLTMVAYFVGTLIGLWLFEPMAKLYEQVDTAIMRWIASVAVRTAHHDHGGPGAALHPMGAARASVGHDHHPGARPQVAPTPGVRGGDRRGRGARLPDDRAAPPPSALRRRDPLAVAGLLDAVTAHGLAGGHLGRHGLLADPPRPLSRRREVGHRRHLAGGRSGAHVPGGRPPRRRGFRRRAGRRDRSHRLPLVRSQRRVPGELPARQDGAPGRDRSARRGDRHRGAGSAGLSGARHQARRPRGLGRLDTAASARALRCRAGRQGHRLEQRRPDRDHPVRQALREEPRPRRPLVQGGAHDPVRRAGGRDSVQHRAPVRRVRGLHAAADGGSRSPGAPAVRRARRSRPSAST